MTEAVYTEKLTSGALNPARVAKSNALVNKFMIAVNRKVNIDFLIAKLFYN